MSLASCKTVVEYICSLCSSAFSDALDKEKELIFFPYTSKITNSKESSLSSFFDCPCFLGPLILSPYHFIAPVISLSPGPCLAS